MKFYPIVCLIFVLTGCGGTAEESAVDHQSTLLLDCETYGGSIRVQGVSDEENTVTVKIDGEVIHNGVIYFSPYGKFHAYFDIGVERHIIYSDSHWVYIEEIDNKIFRDDTGYIVERDGEISKFQPCIEGSTPMNLAQLDLFSVETEDVFVHGEVLARWEVDRTSMVHGLAD